ncbi:hypothetical protein CEXT_530801 [Caerostris extrusa]|uniref:Uncharacterized protein n=1 Tax=Caerostris extrusa TaxID=172846 RepID=A0AAV4WS35_CAEEX|nr:hypothetical protein CEXT_530801 [Caerostris extrusa]
MELRLRQKQGQQKQINSLKPLQSNDLWQASELPKSFIPQGATEMKHVTDSMKGKGSYCASGSSNGNDRENEKKGHCLQVDCHEFVDLVKRGYRCLSVFVPN